MNKKEALAEFLNIPNDKIDELIEEDNRPYSSHSSCYYTVDNVDFWVCTEEEAYKLVEEDLKDLIDDIGVDNFFNGGVLNIENYIDKDAFEEDMQIYYEGYVEDIENERGDHGSRLADEMLEEGVLNEYDYIFDADGVLN